MFSQLLRSGLIAIFVSHAASLANAGVIESDHPTVNSILDHSQRAIGKLVNETGSWCSAAVISDDSILTAAHCLFNRRTDAFIAPEFLHFLLGYQLGSYVAHLRIHSYEIGGGFDPHRYAETVESDWAVLKINGALPTAVVPIKLSKRHLSAGTQAMVVGYSQLRAYAQTNRDCVLGSDIISGKLMLSPCEAQKGFSGAPILVQVDGEMRIAGIQVASLTVGASTGMLAIPADALPHMSGRLLHRHSSDPSHEMQAICALKDQLYGMKQEIALPDVTGLSLNRAKETAGGPQGNPSPLER